MSFFGGFYKKKKNNKMTADMAYEYTEINVVGYREWAPFALESFWNFGIWSRLLALHFGVVYFLVERIAVNCFRGTTRIKSAFLAVECRASPKNTGSPVYRGLYLERNRIKQKTPALFSSAQAV